MVKKNQEIFDIAAEKGKKIWPKSVGSISDLEFATKWIFYQVAKGMEYLHTELHTVHRDLKHHNILMGL